MAPVMAKAALYCSDSNFSQKERNTLIFNYVLILVHQIIIIIITIIMFTAIGIYYVFFFVIFIFHVVCC